MPIKERVEYVIKAKVGQGGHKGEERFVPNAHQSDVTKAVEHFNMIEQSMNTKTHGHIITIEKHIIKTKIMDFTKDARKLLENGNA